MSTVRELRGEAVEKLMDVLSSTRMGYYATVGQVQEIVDHIIAAAVLEMQVRADAKRGAK